MSSDKREAIEAKRDRYLNWLRISYAIIQNRVPDILNYESDMQRAYEAAKQIIIELWTVRSFLLKLGLQAEKFDDILPNLKIFRDAIAHIDERSDETMRVGGGPRETKRARNTLAGGLLTTDDGVRWSGFRYCYGLIGSETGLYTPFGLIRNWAVTNTTQGAVELLLDANLFSRLNNFLRQSRVIK